MKSLYITGLCSGSRCCLLRAQPACIAIRGYEAYYVCVQPSTSAEGVLPLPVMIGLHAWHLKQCSGNSPVDNRMTQLAMLCERDRNQSLEAQERRERELAIDRVLPQRVRDAPVLTSSSG